MVVVAPGFTSRAVLSCVWFVLHPPIDFEKVCAVVVLAIHLDELSGWVVSVVCHRIVYLIAPMPGKASNVG